MLIVDASVRAFAVAGGVGLVLAAARIHSSAIRHAAWASVLAAMWLLPIAPAVLPDGVAVPIPAPVIESFRLPLNAASPPIITGGVRPALPISSAPGADSGQPSAPEPGRGISWRAAGAAVYAAVAIMLLLRMLYGWRAMRRVHRAARPAAAGAFLECPYVAAPVTVGILAPRVVLPTGWRAWPDEKLRAVLAHERAHVRRRDPLVAFFARVSCCVFWFHPLAWWLEHRLAATAEHASDDEAIRAIGDARRYAQVLVDIAASVRQRGGRVAWQAVGVSGNGLLGGRIDRVLRGDLLRQPSRFQRMGVALGCASVILLIVACRQPPVLSPMPLDPAVAAARAQMKERQALYESVHQMTPAQVKELEETWNRNRENLDALDKLLISYGPDVSGKPVPDAPRIIAARRPLILWLIEHHPESELAGHLEAKIFSSSRDWLPDPEGYAMAKKLWLGHCAKPDVVPATLGNAASFLAVADKPAAEQLLLRAAAADPNGRWKQRLGSLYGQILVGSQRFTLYNVVNAADVAAAHGWYALQIREKLDASRDSELLRSTGRYLTINAGQVQLDFDQVALGASYIDRAVALDRDSIEGRSLQVQLRDRARYLQAASIRRTVSGESQYRAVAALPERERFQLLPLFADDAYALGESSDYYKHDRAAAESAWDLARRYAEDALSIAEKFRADPEYGTVVYKSNMVLSSVAMRRGDKQRAVAFLDRASLAPTSPELTYTQDLTGHRPVAYLLKYGERDAVVNYLERMARVNLTERSRLLDSARLLRDGKLPWWYQAQLGELPNW